MSTTTPLTTATRTQDDAATRARPLAIGSVVAAAGFAATLVIAGLVDPGYSQSSEGISALASTESHAAPIMIAGFVLLAIVALASGGALLRTLRGPAGRTAGALTVLAGVLTLACGLVRQSCSSLQQTCLDRESSGSVSGAHVAHNMMALPMFASLAAAGILIASTLKRDPRWQHLSRQVRLAAVAGLTVLVWFGSGAYGDNGGLVQRLLVLLAYGIPVAVAIRITRPTARIR